MGFVEQLIPSLLCIVYKLRTQMKYQGYRSYGAETDLEHEKQGNQCQRGKLLHSKPTRMLHES